MAAWVKTALLCGSVLSAGIVLAGCSSKTETTSTTPPAPTQAKAAQSSSSGRGAAMDMNDYPAPSGAKTGDFSGGLGKKH